MKAVIVTIPMIPPHRVNPMQYPVDGNKAVEYEHPVRYAINSVLAKTLKKGEQVKVILILTIGENSEYAKNKDAYIEELENINKDIRALLSYDTVMIDFSPTKQTYNKLITDLAEKIPENAQVFADYTFGFKPATISLFCALRFVEEFRGAVVEYIVYGKVEFNRETNKPEKPMLFDITSLYYLFKLMGTMGTADTESALKMLQDFFAL